MGAFYSTTKFFPKEKTGKKLRVATFCWSLIANLNYTFNNPRKNALYVYTVVGYSTHIRRQNKMNHTKKLPLVISSLNPTHR